MFKTVPAMPLTAPYPLVPVPEFEGRPVYMQDWFVAIAARGRTLRVEVVEDRAVVGSLSCSLYSNPLGMRQGYNLPWAHLGGPIIESDVDPLARRKLIKRLIAQLPTNRSYFMTLSNEEDFKTFLASGFESNLEDNFVIPADQAATWERRLSKMSARHLRTGARALDVLTFEPSAFIRMYNDHLVMRRRKPYADLTIASDILAEASRRGQARVIAARRRDTGEFDAAVACLWDSASCYYWMTTRRPAINGATVPHQGAIKLLMHAAIKHAHAKGLTFDFDGVATDKIANLYAGMGGTKSVRYRVMRQTTCERLVGIVRSPLKTALRNTIGRLVSLKLN